MKLIIIRKPRKQDLISVIVGTAIAISVWIFVLVPTYH
jgi:hypothetical protein